METPSLPSLENQTELIDPSNTEAIQRAAEDTHNESHLDRASAHAHFAYHGLRRALAERSSRRAEETAQRQNDKAVRHLESVKAAHQLARSDETKGKILVLPNVDANPVSTQAKPRNMLERHLDRQLSKKVDKQIMAAAHARKIEKVYGTKESKNKSTTLGKYGQKYALWQRYRRGGLSHEEYEVEKLRANQGLPHGRQEHKIHGVTSESYRKSKSKLKRSIGVRHLIVKHHERKAVNAEARMFRNRRAAERHSVQQAKIRDERLAS